MNSATIAQNWSDSMNDFGLMIAQSIPAMLLILAALIGLAWGIKKFLQHVAKGGTGFLTGYYNGKGYMKNQELGKMQYDIKTKGKWSRYD